MNLTKIAEGALGLYLLSPFDGDITITTILGVTLLADAFEVSL